MADISVENATGSGAKTVASSSRTTTVPAMAAAEKPRKFSGIDFKRWQQKMFFYLTTLSLQKFITEEVPVLPEETPDNERFIVTEASNHSDFLCKNYILNGLDDGLCNVYSGCKTSKKLWSALDKKYKTEDAGLKKFVAAKFLDFKMVDHKSVMLQLQELQVITHDLLAEGMVVNGAFQVAAFIEKLPPSWKDFKNYLKHKRKEMTLEDLIVRLRIKEDNRSAEKKANGKQAITSLKLPLQVQIKGSGLLEGRMFQARRNSKEVVTIAAKLDTWLQTVVLRQRIRRRKKVKPIWLK
ncbi:uncharacterized protein LOC132608204 [Lycium barbarum]|uniref:uncharacterized protein LOC132608204 n=1 Tax=Lycium barbarum TaxID=112863 RepID=UPI00293F5AB1|nr:uncharacterized protein LOC132608204 [Lycium barbarum]